KIRAELLGLPDRLLAATMIVFFTLLVLLQWYVPAKPHAQGPPAPHADGVNGLQVIFGALFFALIVAVILALLIGRNIDVVELFGLGRVGIVRGMAMVGGLTLLLLPMFYLV